MYFNRTIPRVEIEAVSTFLLHLLTGDVSKLPTETLVHKFWSSFETEHKQAAEYLSCLRKYRLTSVHCSYDIRIHCGSHFGQKPPERLELCRKLLANEIIAATDGIPRRIARIIDNYHSCFHRYRSRVDTHCTEVLRRVITDHRLRVAKVVRATMDSMGPLLRALPNLRVIHLVRDPRAVALSRIRFDDSGRGAYTLHIRNSESSLVAEASLYCHHVTADIRSRLALEREFPGRIMSVRYEDVVANPEQAFRDVYKLLDETVPKATFEAMQKMARKGQTMNLPTKWRSKLTYEGTVAIVQQCDAYFRLLNVSVTDTSTKRSFRTVPRADVMDDDSGDD